MPARYSLSAKYTVCTRVEFTCDMASSMLSLKFHVLMLYNIGHLVELIETVKRISRIGSIGPWPKI